MSTIRILLAVCLTISGSGFSTEAQEIPLTVVQSQSSIAISVLTSSDSSAVSGMGAIILMPPMKPFSTAQMTELDLTLVDGISLSILGGLVSVSTSPNAIMLTMTEAGEPGEVDNANQFNQFGNTAELSGNVNVFDPFNLVGGSMSLDLSTIGPTPFDMVGIQLAISDNTLTVSTAFDVVVPVTKTIDANISGTIVLTGELPELLLGDVNCDGKVNLLDVSAFIDVLLNGPYMLKADINQDGFVDLLDVQPFVDLLVNP